MLEEDPVVEEMAKVTRLAFYESCNEGIIDYCRIQVSAQVIVSWTLLERERLRQTCES